MFWLLRSDLISSQSQSNKFIGMAMKTLEDNFPKQAKGLSKLTDFYGWSSNKDQEYDLLKNIVRQIGKRIWTENDRIEKSVINED